MSSLGRAGRIVYTAVLFLAACALCWLSLANTTSLVLGKKNPEFALRLGLASAETKATLALSIMTDHPSADQLPRARRLAQAALRREPVNATAAVALGMIAAVEKKANLAQQLIDYSEHVSRRNAIAQLWMIENQVARGDVAGALVHYDRVMRVTPSLRATLVPILVQASADPAVAQPLAVILGRRPLWWPDLMGPMIHQGAAPAVTLPVVLRRLRLRPGNDQERTFLTAAMRRLADTGAFNQADMLYRQAGGKALTGDNLVRNGDFEADNLLPPFDWDLHDEAGLAATVQSRGEGRSLFLSVDQEHQGELARQLLRLKPGHYRFTALAGNVEGDVFARPQVRLLCAAAGSRALLDLHLNAAGDAGARSQGDFDVPSSSSCPAQWLLIASGASEQTGEDEPWIDEITVRPIH